MHLDDGALHAYLDGELDGHDELELRTHLSACSACQERFEIAAEQRALASDLLADLVAPDAPAWSALVARARPESEPVTVVPVPAAAPRPWAVPALAWAATVVLAFAIGWQANRSPSVPRRAAVAERDEPAPPGETGRRATLEGAEREAALPAEPSEPASATPAVGSQAGAYDASSERLERDVSLDDRLAPAPERAAVAPAEAAEPPIGAQAVVAPPTALAGRVAEESPAAAKMAAAFQPIAPDDATALLGGSPLELDAATLVEMAVGPVGVAAPERLVLRTIWELADGARVTLLQQPAFDADQDSRLAERPGEDDEARQPLRQTGARRRAPSDVGGASGVVDISRPGFDALRAASEGDSRVAARVGPRRVVIASSDLDATALEALLARLR